MKKELEIKVSLYDKLYLCVHSVGCFCYIYAFLGVLYWFLNIFDIKWIQFCQPIFEPIFDITRSLYEQPEFMSADMAGMVTCIVIFVCGILCQIYSDKIKRDKEAEIIRLEKKFIDQDLAQQKAIQNEYVNEMKKYNKFIVLVDLNIQKVKSYLFEDNIDNDELVGIKINLMAELFDAMREKYIITKAKYQKDSFYVIGSIENTPECIRHIIKTIKDLSRKYSHLNITLTHDLSFDAICDEDIKKLDNKLELLKKIIQLNYNSSTLTTARFKTSYEIISKSTLRFFVMGKFQLKVNNVPTNCELYSVKLY